MPHYDQNYVNHIMFWLLEAAETNHLYYNLSYMGDWGYLTRFILNYVIPNLYCNH